MNPRVMILIDTYSIGGAGKVVLQFLRSGGTDICFPIVTGFWRGPDGPWQFREAITKLDVKFEVLKQKFAFDPLVIRDALRLVRNHNIEILESHGYKGHVVCLALKKITQLPWVAYVHGWTQENMKVAIYNQIDRAIVRFADRIVPVSKDLGRRLHLGARGQQKLVTVNNSADLPETGMDNVDIRSDLKIDQDEILVGVVGRLSPEKGHRYFLEAMCHIPSDTPLKAVFVGEGQERNRLSDEINKRGLRDKVAMVGFQADVSPFYRACDIIVLPSLIEGMPNAALEAMSFGKPVVASHVGGIPELVMDGETGLLVPPCNREALASALTRLAADRLQMKKFGLAGRQRVERHFNHLDRLRKVADIYRQVLHV